MTDLERVTMMYNLVLGLVVMDKKVTVKTKCFYVIFYIKNDMYYMRTEKVNASSKHLHSLYDLVAYTIADKSLCDDIEIIADDKVFAIIKN